MMNESLLAYWLISLLANGGETKFRIVKIPRLLGMTFNN